MADNASRPSRRLGIYRPVHLRTRPLSARARSFALVCVQLAVLSLLTALTVTSPSSAATITTTSISAGAHTACAIQTGGVAYCWGDNTYGQFGNGTTTSSSTPQLVTGNYNWASISTHSDSYPGDNTATTCGITTAGVGYCWGANANGEVGDGTTTQRTTPTIISGGYTWQSLSVGWVSVCGVTTGGVGYCWGYGMGQLGDGTTNNHHSPAAVSGGLTWASISTGWANTCGVTTAGAGYCWGQNGDGEVGDNSTSQRTSPTAVSGGYTWSRISEGAYDSCGLTTAGAAYCWGGNFDGEHGTGNDTQHLTPAAVNGGYTWSSLSEGTAITCGVTTAGAGYCWGKNNAGEMGDSDAIIRNTPTAISGGLTFSSISAGMDYYDDTTCGLTTAGVAYCWGNNDVSQVGDRTTINRQQPTAVNWVNVGTSALVAAGGQTNSAIKTGGLAYCWGDNTYGQLGNGTTTSSPSPQLVLSGYMWKSISTSNDTAPGDNVATTCGVTTAGAGYCWGGNAYGEVGNNSTTQVTTPTLISGGYTWASITVGWVDVCGVTVAGAGYCWGYNGAGSVGDNTTTERNVPTAVSGGYTWSQITPGYLNSCGVTNTGAGYCWGQNAQGEVGDNTTTERNTPTTISGAYTWASISPGTLNACGITTAGVGYCWGDNTYGQIGDNTTTNRHIPTAASGGYTWAQISEGYGISCGVTTAGVGYCWGANQAGELGDGSTGGQSNIPTAVSGGFAFSTIVAGSDQTDDTECGFTTAGLTYCWGYNNKYQVGDETTTNRDVPTAVIWPSATPVTQIAPGDNTTCAIRAGNAYCWGDNTYGQIGDGTKVARTTPALVAGGYTWSTIATQTWPGNSTATTCGITTSGAGYCWGDNTSGTIGDGTTTQRLIPTAISGGYTWQSIVVGFSDVCGITTSGAAYCWGYNSLGEVGDNTTTPRSSPTAVSGGYTWASLSEGDNQTCGVTTSGVGYCWGGNWAGQAGYGNWGTNQLVPTVISGSHTWSNISVGTDDACGVTTAGAGYCWGADYDGETGNGSSSNTPALVSGGYTWSQIAEGNDTSCGITTAGVAYCWGDDVAGDLGDGITGSNTGAPTAVLGGLVFQNIARGVGSIGDGYNSFCAITVGGSAYCWGYNGTDQVGDGTTTDRNVPTAVSWAYPASQISAGGQTSCAVKSGNAYCWGDNTYGQVGDNTNTARTTPTLVSGGYTWKSVSTQDDTHATDDVATTCGITTSGAGYCWGANTYGDVGDNTTTPRWSPTAVSGGLTWASLSVGSTDVCGVTTGGAGYCWGLNWTGEVGDNTTTERNSPTLVSGGYTWAQITEGYGTSCGVTTAGAGYCWGYNSTGQVGDTTTTARYVATVVNGGYTWSQISAGENTTCGVTISGTGYCWGVNTYGQVGDGTTTQRNVPTALAGSFTWAQISVSDASSCGVTTLGAGYCWGGNWAGEVGDGTTTQRNVPTAVSGGLMFTNIASGSDPTDETHCGLTSGGTEYCWGYNNKDQVGDGTTTNRYTPTMVVWPMANPVSSIGPGGHGNCAIRNYNAYCWGDNTYGQIGDGTTTARTIPTLVSGGYRWASISSDTDTNGGDNVATACAVTTTGAGYCWGGNKYGNVGDGTTTQRTTPTLVSGGYNWKSISVGDADTCGVTTTGAGYCWGYGADGEIGDNTGTQRTSPTLVNGSYTWASISSGDLETCGTTTAGVGYCWGTDWDGNGGDGTTSQSYVPTLVAGSHTWSSITTGEGQSCGVTTAGAGYCWGGNNAGQVGDNTTTQRTSPTSVNGGFTWASISAGANTTCGVTTAGAGYCWGGNWAGEVGDATTTQRYVPTAVSGGLTFSTVLSGADTGSATNCGITTNGAEYCWGSNGEDQVGDQTATDRNAPTAVNWTIPAPNTPASLAQFQSDGVTSLSIGGYVQSGAVMTATVTDPDPSQVDSLCVEAIPTANTFTNTATYCGSPVASGATASVTAFGLTTNAYKWQAEVVNGNNLSSAWVAYNTGSTAFNSDTTPPTTGTIYDGSSAGVESGYNNGSLSQLSCNWSGFSDSGSGMASYDYSFGTSPGDTSTLGWTNVASSTTLVNVSSLTLHTGQVYYCNVRAHDVVGNISASVNSSGQMVAPTLTFSTSSNSVSLPLNALNSYTDSQAITLTTSTNGYNGYVISTYENGLPTSGSHTVADYSAPATAPTTWSGTGFGYTVSGGAAAAGFSAGSKYAHFGTAASPDTPINHSGPISGSTITNEQETVTFKMVTDGTQAAGAYANQVKWSCVVSY